MNDAQLLRYGRQILLPQVGISGQDILRQSTVLIIGLGGLGSPVAMYLAAAGIGHLLLADFDRVELSNLQRQIVHGSQDVGNLKTASAAHRLTGINPDVRISPIEAVLDDESLQQWVSAADVVIDGSDNFATRFAANRACVALGKPLVSGAVIRFEGQITVFDPRISDSPCYRCLYREGEELAESCSQTGVLAPVPGIIGSMQATEALKLLLGLPSLAGRLLIMDALSMEWRSLKLRKDPACPVCGNPP